MEDLKSALTAVGVLFAISNIVLGFIWKNLKDDISEVKQTAQMKADKSEVDQRRNDIRDLYAKMQTLETEGLNNLHAVEIRIIGQISELKGMLNVANTRRD
jgi:type II secretory pathway component PulM